MKASVIGLGVVGNAMYQSFKTKISELPIVRDEDNEIIEKYVLYGYDKYKNIGTFEKCLDSSIIFLVLPTLFNNEIKGYDNSPTLEVLTNLELNSYHGIVVIKSTVEPTFTDYVACKFPYMEIIHNPEFLSASTAFDDFHNQKHVVLGRSCTCSDSCVEFVTEFYRDLYPNATISTCTSTESESMKIFCNSFYSVKLQFFNELYLLSQKLGSSFEKIVELMIKNEWINPMHTKVPGTDGKLSYGGMCFPKDTNALLEFMKNNNTPCGILDACVSERNSMRDD